MQIHTSYEFIPLCEFIQSDKSFHYVNSYNQMNSQHYVNSYNQMNSLHYVNSYIILIHFIMWVHTSYKFSHYKNSYNLMNSLHFVNSYNQWIHVTMWIHTIRWIHIIMWIHTSYEFTSSYKNSYIIWIRALLVQVLFNQLIWHAIGTKKSPVSILPGMLFEFLLDLTMSISKLEIAVCTSDFMYCKK